MILIEIYSYSFYYFRSKGNKDIVKFKGISIYFVYCFISKQFILKNIIMKNTKVF